MDLFKIFWKQLTICGSTMGSTTDFEHLLQFIGERKFKPIVDQANPLPEGNQAFRRMADGLQHGTIVLKIA